MQQATAYIDSKASLSKVVGDADDWFSLPFTDTKASMIQDDEYALLVEAMQEETGGEWDWQMEELMGRYE